MLSVQRFKATSEKVMLVSSSFNAASVMLRSSCSECESKMSDVFKRCGLSLDPSSIVLTVHVT
jgi:hypothetical protein